MASVYTLNKSINQPIEFKGLKAQYIGWLGIGLLILLILFAILYICGVPTLLCLLLIIVLAGLLFIRVYQLSHRYGQHGMMKAIAQRSIPKTIRLYSRKVFVTLRKGDYS